MNKTYLLFFYRLTICLSFVLILSSCYFDGKSAERSFFIIPIDLIPKHISRHPILLAVFLFFMLYLILFFIEHGKKKSKKD